MRLHDDLPDTENMNANVIPLRPKTPRRRVVRRTVAPVIELEPALVQRRKRERLDELAMLIGEAMTEYRRLRGLPDLPPRGPGTALAR